MGYYILRARFLKPVEGEEESKNVTESFLINAVSVTDAEAKFIGWCPSNYRDVAILGAQTFDIDNIIHGDNEEHQDYYIARIGYPVQQKKSIKWKSFQMMVNGENIEKALATVLKEYSSGSTEDYKVKSISDSKIVVDKDLL